MRVLLDECLPRRLKKELVAHDVQTVPDAGWAGRKNGELLRLAAGKFDAFITIDRNIVYEQRIPGLPFGVVVLSARSNRFADLQPLVPEVLEALAALRPGEVIRIAG